MQIDLTSIWRGKLEYRVPELIAEAAAKGRPDKPMDVLDLGCGTGLCGMLLKPIAGVVWGIDLSPLMIAKSKARGVYDRLEQGDVVQVMQAMDQQFDLVVAGDVIIYVGDLTPVFTQIVRRLRPGGRVIASIESGGGDRYQMGKKSLRYSHSRPYLATASRRCSDSRRRRAIPSPSESNPASRWQGICGAVKLKRRNEMYQRPEWYEPSIYNYGSNSQLLDLCQHCFDMAPQLPGARDHKV